MTDGQRAALVVATLAVIGLTAVLGALATAVPADQSSEETRIRTADSFGALHDRGLTGANVSVGVVDVTRFDTDAPALSGRIRAARAFGSGTVDTSGRTHGTAAATVVARTAPDSDLYLATVGGIDGYERAVEWLTRRGVDVVVAPVSFYGRPGDGRGAVGEATERATGDGTVVVAPSGNLARSHWEGRYDAATADNGTVQFAGGDDRMAIDGPTEVTVWLSWDRAHGDEDYTAELYRTDVNGSRLVARSQPFRADGTPNERIVAAVSPGRYALVVSGPPEPTGARVQLVTPRHDIEYARGRGSIVAPGTAPGALTVGAYSEQTGRVEPFSSRGPTADGRTGVDVVAPDRRYATLTDGGFVGSSAATPYVGGLVALLLQADPSLTPAETELLVERTARDIRQPGVDAASGHGVVRPVRAAAAADNATAAAG